jgi:hypothetical protein
MLPRLGSLKADLLHPSPAAFWPNRAPARRSLDGRLLARRGAPEVIMLLKSAILAFAMSCGTDAASSHYALLHPGTHEGGVFLTQNPWINDSVLVGSTAGIAALVQHSPHPRLAAIGLFGLTSLHVWATAHNAQLTHR